MIPFRTLLILRSLIIDSLLIVDCWLMIYDRRDRGAQYVHRSKASGRTRNPEPNQHSSISNQQGIDNPRS
jgi:hypothetical protein